MFNLKRPCKTCPFKADQGTSFSLGKSRLEEIFSAIAFQCHSTIDYDSFEDPIARQGDKPQQCAGLMSLLHRDNRPNAIMQIAERLGYFDGNKLDHSGVYNSIAECMRDHTKRVSRRVKK